MEIERRLATACPVIPVDLPGRMPRDDAGGRRASGRSAIERSDRFRWQQEEIIVYSSRLLRLGLMAIGVVAVAIGSTLWSWSYTTSRLAAARSTGVFPSPAEGMLALVQSGWTGIEEARIVHAMPESAPLGGPHIWYAIACVWADSREDGSPTGSPTHEFDAPGSYFVDTNEGWVLMPESASPLLVALGMRVFGLAGDHPAQPFHDPSIESAPMCVRQATPG